MIHGAYLVHKSFCSLEHIIPLPTPVRRIMRHQYISIWTERHWIRSHQLRPESPPKYTLPTWRRFQVRCGRRVFRWESSPKVEQKKGAHVFFIPPEISCCPQCCAVQLSYTLASKKHEYSAIVHQVNKGIARRRVVSASPKYSSLWLPSTCQRYD